MRQLLPLGALLLAAALPACAGGGSAPVAPGPAAAPDAAWRRAVAERREAAAAPLPARWALGDVLDRIVVANPTLSVAEARLAEAAAALERAERTTWPEARLGVSWLVTDSPAQAFALKLDQRRLAFGPGLDLDPGATTNLRAEARFDWVLWSEGLERARDAAAEGERAAAWQVVAAERALLEAGVQAWLGLRAARELAAVAEDHVAVVEARLELTRRRAEEGAALPVDVMRLETRLAAARQRSAEARLGAELAASALGRLMDLPPGTALDLDPAGEDEVGAGLPDDLDALLAMARDQRPDLRAAEAGLRAAERAVAAAAGARWPVLQAMGGVRHDSRNLDPDPDRVSWDLGLAFVLPLSATTGAEVRVAEARRLRAEAELRGLLQAAAHEVGDARHGVAAARAGLEAARAAERSAEEAWRVTREAHAAGAVTTTDLLEAEDALRRARVARVQAELGVGRARARLAAAVGALR